MAHTVLSSSMLLTAREDAAASAAGSEAPAGAGPAR